MLPRHSPPAGAAARHDTENLDHWAATVKITSFVTRRRARVPVVLYSLVMIGLLLALWQVIAASGRVPAYFLPTPLRTWQAFLDIATHGYRGHTLFEHVGASLGRVLLAFAGSTLLGVPIGLLVGSSRRVRALVTPLLEFYRPLPPLAYYTLLVIWLGIGDLSKVTLLLLAGLPPVIIATAGAVGGLRPDFIHGARSLGATRWQVFRYVVLPGCLPEIFTGLRVSIGFIYTTLVAAEMVAGVNGLGWLVLDASKFLQSDVIFVGIFLMGLTGLLLDAILRTIERLAVPWRGRV
jgi:taurine transport system permease protein